MTEVALSAMIYVDVTGPLAWFLAAWLLALGGGIGSFMNVVVYRVPAGLSVVYPGSRCPRCGKPIRGFDNIPVISWLVLRGRCRNCSLPIAKRYPFVEALVATLFFTTAAMELFSGGANLPNFAANARSVPLSLFGTYLCQMLALCTLVCAALMEYDGQRMPKRLLIYAIVTVVLATAWLSELPPLPVFGSRPHWSNGLVGAAAGALLGLIARLRFAKVYEQRSTPELELMLVGAVTGWQLVTLLACVAVILHLGFAALRVRDRSASPLPWNALLAAGLFLVIIFFAHIIALLPARVLTDPLTLAVVAVFVACASWLTSLCERRLSAEPKGKSPVHVDPLKNQEAILKSPSYRIAAYDMDFLHREELRPVRLQLELLKPEMAFQEHDIRSTIVAFGGTQIVERHEAERRLQIAKQRRDEMPDELSRQREVVRAESILAKSKYYDAAHEFGRLVSSACQINGHCDYVIITGGGPGIMEAANRGAFDVGAKSVGLNITLPAEQAPNAYITPELCFQFHYFALRKMHFLLRAKALVVFPGGFGTLDELFDALTLRQTQRMQEIPIILFGREYWSRVINFQFMADEGVIADAHLDLVDYAETPDEAWDIICRFHEQRGGE